MFDYSLLRGKIRTVCKTEKNFASQMGVSNRTMSLKLNGKIYFNNLEILKAIKILGIAEDDIDKYFFSQNSID